MVTFGAVVPGRDVAVRSGAAWAGVTTGGSLAERAADPETVSSGWPALDGLLPGRGVRRGSLIEWLAGDAGATDPAGGAGAATLACALACRLAAARGERRGPARGGLIVVVDRAGWFHPPAVLPWLGADAATACRLVVARPARDDDEIWTIEQALRCAGVAAVVAWPRLQAAWSLERGVVAERGLPRRAGLQQWTTAMRRWQLAARSTAAVGLFVRSPTAIREPSWAESRLAVSPCPGGGIGERRLRIARVGGAWCGAGAGGAEPVEIVIDLMQGRAVAVDAVPEAGRRRATLRPQPDAVAGRGAACRAS